MIKQQRRWSAAMLIFILIGISGCTAGESPIVLGTNKEESLWASGTIRATELRLASEQGGRIDALSIEEGLQVKKGDTLVVIDATPWLLQLYPAEAAVATAKADLAELKAGARTEEIEAARASLALAEAQRDGAKAAWGHALAQVRNPQDIDTQIIEARTTATLAAQAVEKAQSDLQIAEFTYDRREMTAKQSHGWELRSAQQALASAQASQKAAQAALDHLEAIRERPLGYIALAHAAEGEYRVAEEGVVVAQAKLDDLLDGPTAEEIAVAEAAVRQAEAEAAIIRVQVEKCTLTSPIDGIVLEQAFQMGEIVAPAATILTLADLNELTLEVYVPENRVGQVQLGQEVTITVDSFPGKSFQGTVTRIGDSPEYTPRNVATAEERLNTFYVVEIHLPNPDGTLKSGMPADAAF